MNTPYEIRWHGPIYGQSGYEYLTRGLLIALDKLGIKIQLHPDERWNLEKISLPFNVVRRLLRMQKTRVSPTAPLVMHQKFQEPYVGYPGKKFIYTLFETNKVPEPWRDGLLASDGVFVFSDWNRQMWENDGIPQGKITTLPFGLDVDQLDPKKAKPLNILNKKEYVFLASGDFQERKNFTLLVEAFCKEFKPSENVCLIIKTHCRGFIKPFKEMVYSDIRKMAKNWAVKPPKILVNCDKLSDNEIPRLYASAHCFVLPTRGEGLCLPVAEAMAMGLPVITTGWGGQVDYIKHMETGILLDYRLDQILDMNYIQKCIHALGHSWAEASLEDLQKRMRWAFDNRSEANEMGKRAGESMRDKHWHYSALKLLKTIFNGVAKDGGQRLLETAGGVK